jgi:hypothetical protein
MVYIIELKGTRYVADRATRYQARAALLLLFSPVEAKNYKMDSGEGM